MVVKGGADGSIIDRANSLYINNIAISVAFGIVAQYAGSWFFSVDLNQGDVFSMSKAGVTDNVIYVTVIDYKS